MPPESRSRGRLDAPQIRHDGVRELVHEDVLAVVTRPRIAEEVFLGAGRRIPAEPARAPGMIVAVRLVTGSPCGAPGRLLFWYSGMSDVISVSAITPVRHCLATIDFRISGRAESIAMMMSRITSSASSGTRSDEITGMP